VKICYYTMGHPLAKTSFGGAEMQLHLIGKELQGYGWEPHYIIDAVDGKGDETIAGQHLHYIHTFKQSAYWLARNAPYLALNMLGSNSNPFFSRIFAEIDADIYHQRGSSIATGYFASEAKKRKKPFVFTVAHVEDCTLSGDLWDTFAKRAIKKGLYLYGIKNADVVIATADYLKDAFENNFPGKDIRVIRSGHPVPKKPKKAGAGPVLWIGRAESYKNCEAFAALAKKFPKYKFVAIGNVQVAEKPANLVLTGFLPNDKVNEWLEKAAVLVDTSDSAGFPNTFIQAWLRATPTLSLHVDPDGLNKKYDIGVCVKGSVENLSESLRIILDDDGLRKKLGDNAYKYASVSHDIRTTGREHDKLYLELIEKANPK